VQPLASGGLVPDVCAPALLASSTYIGWKWLVGLLHFSDNAAFPKDFGGSGR
jgi:hypothetical protein